MNLREQALPLLGQARAVEVAARLGVSEGELLAALPGTRRLRLDVRAMLEGLERLSRPMALTRNRWAVHEKRGAFSPWEVHGPAVAGVYGEEIDLRYLVGRWSLLLAAEVPNRRGPLPSLQVFDASGQAVHKVYALEEADQALLEALVTGLAADEPPEAWRPSPPALEAPEGPEQADTLLEGWAALADTHDFLPLLRRARFARSRALEAAEGRFTWALPVEAVERVLRDAAERRQPILVFVSNPGAVQIHGGPIARVHRAGDWLNVLDPGFDLHLDLRGFARVWAVEKPTRDGPVRSLEVIGPDGSLVVQLFGQRKPGKPEDPGWSALVAERLEEALGV
jgi:putative hemin transport protein